MRAEKIFKNKAGANYKIVVELVGMSSDSASWRVTLWKQEKGKRLWNKVSCEDDPGYAKMDPRDKQKYYLSHLATIVPVFWIREVQGMIVKKLSKAVI